MSSFLDDPLESFSFFIRNAVVEDFDVISEMLRVGKCKYFGPSKRKCKDANYFFGSYATHRMLVTERFKNAIIGYAEFTNFPPILALPKDCWYDWFTRHYCTNLPISPTNTLFLNYFIFSKHYMPHLLRAVLEECYVREHGVQFIITVEMPNQHYHSIFDRPHYYWLEEFSVALYPRQFSVISCKNVQHLHIIERKTILMGIRARKALPEDNDDLIEIIDTERPEMREEAGDFFIAEELLREDSNHNHLIVVEVDNNASGLIWLNDNVDVVRIAEKFDLEPFNNLLKFTSQKRYSEKIIKVGSLVRKQSATLFLPKHIMQKVDAVCCSEYSSPSTVSVSSKIHVLHVKSDSGLINIPRDHERYNRLHLVFERLRAIQDLLTNRSHYLKYQHKTLHIWFNVDDHAHDMLVPLDNMSNVFALQLLAMREDVDFRRTYRFLTIAFSAFPDRDYCVLSAPPVAKQTKTLSEALKYFIPVNPRAGCDIEDRLYITHRSTIFGITTVHPVSESDAPEINQLLNHHVRTSSIMKPVLMFEPSDPNLKQRDSYPSHKGLEAQRVHELFDEVLSNPYSEFTFLTIRCGKASINESVIVGYVILRKFTQIELLKSHYKVEQNEQDHSLDFAEIITFCLHPFFRCQCDAIFREIARYTDYWYFFYLKPLKGKANTMINDVVMIMQPIEPVRIKKMVFRRLSLPPEEAKYVEGAFAIFQNNLCPTRYFTNSQTIVIIGFSDVCRCFLRMMAFCWNKGDSQETKMHTCVPRLKVTVIAPPGVVEAEYDNDFECHLCEDQKDCWLNYQNSNAFVRDTVKRMDLRVWVDFVAGNVVAIDRTARSVHLDSKCELIYDYLLLFCDNKFGVPKMLHHSENLPYNYAQFNTRLDKLIFFHKLQVLLDRDNEQPPIKILIYGTHLVTFEFINFLVTHNVNPNWIVLVKPYRIEEVILLQAINNPYVDANIEPILCEMVEDLGVTVYEKFLFSHWHLYETEDVISSIVFENLFGDEEFTIECDFFISFFESPLEPKIGHTLRQSQIDIIQNKIRVDDLYRTSDSHIFAFGRFIEHFHPPNHQFHYVSPVEAAEKILHILDLDIGELPLIENTVKFLKPCFFQVQLPLNYRMCKIMTPKRYIANHINTPITMSTYEDGDFVRVGLNEHGLVQEIVVVTRKDMSFDFLQFFLGKHETMLNNLRANCYLNEVKNLLEFFQEPWTELIMHDYFNHLEHEIKSIISDMAAQFMHMDLDRASRKAAFTKFLNESGATKRVEEVYLKFLRMFRKDFAHPFALPDDFSNIFERHF